MSLLIRNARTLDSQELTCISIERERISRISPNPPSADRDLDAQGALVLPTFVEPHIHLDKVLLSQEFGYSSSIAEARELIKKAKASFTVDGVKERIKRVIPSALRRGVTIIRSQIDVDPVVGLKSLEALNEVRREYAGLVDFQVVANPQEGIIRSPGTEELLYRALESGCDVVGGLPEAEESPEQSRRHLDTVFEIARRKSVDVDVHNDVLPSGRNLEYFLTKVVETHFEGRAASAHNIALAYYPENYANEIIASIKRANVTVITNPCTMMTSGGQHPPPIPRGLTRVRELMRAGVNVTYGIDNMVDPFNPFGDFNPLVNGWLLAYGGQLNSRELFEAIPKMITYNAAKMLRLKGYGLSEGCTADLNVMNYSRVEDALRFGDTPRYVIKRGKVAAENDVTSKLHT